jgi:histidine triad (HIT) family protein
MSDCIFCAIAAHELPATFVREDDEVLAIRDVNPQAPVHILVLPREHIESVAELTGFRLVINTGKNGGQTVDHLHVHLLGGRQMTWPPG